MGRFSKKCPWAEDLGNMVMPSARRRFAKNEKKNYKKVFKEMDVRRGSSSRL